MSFDTRSPRTGAASPDPMWLSDTTPAQSAWRPSVARPPALQAPPKLLAKVGEAFATALAALHDRLLDAGPRALEANLAELERLENLGLQVQQMARVMGHDGAHAVENIDLADAVQRALVLWSTAARARGVVLNQPDATSARVQVDAAVFEQLIDLTLEHALDAGDSVALRVRPQPAAQQALLLIDVQRTGPITSAASGRGDAPEDDEDDLRWLMLSQVARASGIAARRERSGSMLSVVLTFPMATLGSWYPATAEAVDLAGTAGVRGGHVLIIDPRSRSRLQARELLLAAGLRADAAANLDQARLALRDREPDVLITGFPANDPEAARFIDDLRTSQPRLGVIELVDPASGFMPTGLGTPGCVSRAEMASALVSAVVLELEAARGA